MIRKLRHLSIATVALMMWGVLGATGAQASEEKFHCSVEPCRLTVNQDGTGTTAHSVLAISDGTSSVSLTCKRVTGDARAATKITEEVATTGLAYDECNAAGELLSIRVNECGYLFTARNGGTAEGAAVHLQCPGSKHVEAELTATGCVLEVTPQTLLGAHYHNIGKEGENSTEVTVEANMTGIAVEPIAADTKAKCLGLDVTKTLTAKLTTANVIVTGETAPEPGSPTMTNAWWA